MGDYLQPLSEYYKSRAWAEKRNARLKNDGYKCARCGFTRALEVHHINYDRLYNEDISRGLVTLCKKCHKEIETQKKEHDPIQAEHHTVYLAGKIRENGWRIAYGEIGFYEYDSVETLASEFTHRVGDWMTVTGPVFLACDHGCYHGPGSHGVGADYHGGCSGNEICRKDVLYVCKSQIDRAEIVFAYIDCGDCYGTIAEIGYAHAMGKDIVIVFASQELKEEMWFVDKMQRNTGVASPEWIKKRLISQVKTI